MEPHTISEAEWAELRQVRAIEEGWGLEPEDDAQMLAGLVYGARFDYFSGSPGYVGPLYVLIGDGDPRVVTTVLRDSNGVLKALCVGPQD